VNDPRCMYCRRQEEHCHGTLLRPVEEIVEVECTDQGCRARGLDRHELVAICDIVTMRC
jgi:hypothetical protein